jgi:hypothetical protein
VQKNVLTIEGWTQLAKPQGGEELGREFGAGRFRRDFALPDAVDPERIQARAKNGVLTVTIPKKEEVKARKIQVRADQRPRTTHHQPKGGGEQDEHQESGAPDRPQPLPVRREEADPFRISSGR